MGIYLHVYVLVCILASLPVLTPTKPEQARWSAERIIYGFLIGMLLLSCAMSKVYPSLHDCMWESNGESISYESIKCKMQINKKKPSQSHLYHTATKQQRGHTRRKGLQIGWLETEKRNYVSNATYNWVISGECV